MSEDFPELYAFLRERGWLEYCEIEVRGEPPEARCKLVFLRQRESGWLNHVRYQLRQAFPHTQFLLRYGSEDELYTNY